MVSQGTKNAIKVGLVVYATAFVFLGWCVYKVTEDDIKEMKRRKELYSALNEESVE